MHLKITDAPYFVKIPVRLKITIESKNFGTSVGKPSGVVQVFRTSERIAGSTGEDAGTHDQHTITGNRASTKIKFAYIIGMIADDEKKYKKVKKNLELRKKVVTLLLQLNQTTL